MGDLEARRRLHEVLSAQSRQIERDWAEAVAQLGLFPGVEQADHQSMANRMFPLMLKGLVEGDLSEIAEASRGAVQGKLAVPIASAEEGLRAIMACRQPVRAAAARGAADAEEARRLSTGADLFVDTVAAMVIDMYCTARDREAEHQHRVLMQLSTPVVQVWDDILVLPLIGTLDTMRAKQVIENLLERIVNHQARAAIVDVTGVSTIDSHVARHLLKTVQAARMLGARVVLTGIGPDAAQTITRLGVDLGRVVTCGTLQAGLRMCFSLTGRTIQTARTQGCEASRAWPGDEA